MEDIVTRYIAQTDQYIKEIDEIIKKVREKAGIEEKDAKSAQVNTRSLVEAANQRKRLLTEETANLKRLQAESKKAFTVPEIQKYNSDILKAKNNIALLKGETASLNSVTSGLKSQFAGIGAGILAAFSINALKNFSVEAVNVSAKFQAIRNAIDFTQGSAAKGAETFQFLRDISQSMGLELESTAQSFKLFSASAQLGGISADETRRIFTSVSTAVTAMGLSADDANGVFLALSQIVSKGTVAAEELRGQIGERLPGAFNIAAKAMGVTTAELNKLLTTGNVVASDFLPKFATELQNTFEGALPKAVNSTQANLNRLSNVFTELKISLGDFIGRTGLLSGVTDFFEGLDIALQSGATIIEKSAQRTIQTLSSQLQAEGDAILEARIKQNADFEKFNPVEKEKFIADERIKILKDFKERLIKNQQEIAELTPDAESLSATIRNPALERLEILKRENAAIQILTASKEKDNVVSVEQINTIIKLKKQLELLNTQLNTLPLDNLNKVIDVKKQQDILKEIDSIQKAIDAITGKSSEERIKQAEETRKKLLEIEKKAIEDIGKLQVETEPDETRKIIIEKEINERVNKISVEDKRTTEEIKTSIEEKELQKRVLLNLKAFQEISKAQSIKSFEQDEKNLTEFIEKRTSEIANSNLTIAERENELTALNKTELELRLQNAQQFTGDIIEQQKLIAAAQSNLNKFILEQDKKIAAERLNAAKELQTELDRKRVIETGGGIPGLELEKTLATEKAIRDLADAQTIRDAKTKDDTIAAIHQKLQNDLAEIDVQIKESQIENFRQTFEAIASIASQFTAAFSDLQLAQSDAVIEGLERQQEATEAALNKEQEDLQESRDNRLISEKEFEDRSAKIKNERIVSEKKIGDAIKAEKRKQAEISKAVAVFEATLRFAQAIIVALSSAPPPFNAVLAAISAALAGVQLAAVIATPIPSFATGTKDKKDSGMAIVGERGQELVHLPSAAQVLPAPKTRKNKEIINAMFDDRLDDYIAKKYVQPEVKKQKLSVEKKHEILKQVYEKQAVENYNRNVIDRHETDKTDYINKVVNNILNTKFESFMSDKKQVQEIILKQNELRNVVSEIKTSNLFFNTERKNQIATEIKETVYKNIIYTNDFEKSINTDYVAAALETQRAKTEASKQEAFAQNIANSFMLQNNNQTIFDNEKFQSAIENGVREATKRGIFLRNFEQWAETLADKIKSDPRKKM